MQHLLSTYSAGIYHCEKNIRLALSTWELCITSIWDRIPSLRPSASKKACSFVRSSCARKASLRLSSVAGDREGAPRHAVAGPEPLPRGHPRGGRQGRCKERQPKLRRRSVMSRYVNTSPLLEASDFLEISWNSKTKSQNKLAT